MTRSDRIAPATSAAGPTRAPALVVVAGRVASGKSTVAAGLADRIGAERIEADRIRGTLLAAAAPGSAGAEALWRRDLSPGFEDEIYGDLLRRAERVLESGRPVVLDACFPRRDQRAAARALAANRGLPFLFVECVVSDEVTRGRLQARDRADGLGDHGGWEAIARRIAERFDPPEELPLATTRLTVRSDGAIEPVLDEIVARLDGLRAPPSRDGAHGITPLPRAVTFDCWNTLLVEEDWPWAHELRVSALAQAVREAGVERGRDVVSLALDAAWRQHHQDWLEGRASGAREVATRGLRELEIEAPRPVVEHLVHRFEEASHTSRVIALESAVELLHGLTRRGIACAVICDTGLTPGRVVRRLLDHAGLLVHLRSFAFSDEVGAPKPDPRMFRAALEPLGVTPGEALHVGDLRRTDVAGASAVGMRTARIRAIYDDRSELPEAQYVVASHAELAPLLGVDMTDD